MVGSFGTKGRDIRFQPWLRYIVAVDVTVKALLKVWFSLTDPITMVLIPFVRLLSVLMLPDSMPEGSTDREYPAAGMPPTVTTVICSLGVQPVPLTVVITVPAGPEFGVKVAVAVTVKAPMKFWTPLPDPVIAMVLGPGVVLGTVMVPESTPLLLTDRVLVAVVLTVTAEIVSLAVQPVPLTIITVPTGPVSGIKVAAGVTVKTLLKICALLMFPVITMLFNPGVRAGTVMVPDRIPPGLTTSVFAAGAAPTVTVEIVSLGAQPVPTVIVSVVPTGPLVGRKVAIAVVCKKAEANVWAPLLVPVIIMSQVPVAPEGTVMVPDNTPEPLTDRVFAADWASTVTPVIGSLAFQPVPVTVIVVLTGPFAGVKVAAGVIVKGAEVPVSKVAPPFDA